MDFSERGIAILVEIFSCRLEVGRCFTRAKDTDRTTGNMVVSICKRPGANIVVVYSGPIVCDIRLIIGVTVISTCNVKNNAIIVLEN